MYILHSTLNDSKKTDRIELLRELFHICSVYVPILYKMNDHLYCFFGSKSKQFKSDYCYDSIQKTDFAGWFLDELQWCLIVSQKTELNCFRVYFTFLPFNKNDSFSFLCNISFYCSNCKKRETTHERIDQLIPTDGPTIRSSVFLASDWNVSVYC